MPIGGFSSAQILQTDPRFITSRFPTGKIFYMDDFEATLLKFDGVAFAGGAGGGISRVTTRAHRGEACLKISSGTGDGGGYEAKKDFGRGPNDMVGLELWFNINLSTNDYYTIFGLEHRDGTNLYQAWIEYIKSPSKWRYRTGTGPTTNDLLDLGSQLIPSYTEEAGRVNVWNHFKMVVDLKNHKYHKFYFNERYVDMSSYTMHETAESILDESYRVFIIYQNVSGVTTSADLYIDDLILTHYEP